MSPISHFSDPYDRRARLYPMLVVLSPMLFAVSAWLPSDIRLSPVVGGALLFVAITSFFIQLARDPGRRLEQSLFNRWDGRPTVVVLSYRSGITNADSLRRYHKKIRSLDSSLELPVSEDEENADVGKALAAYRSATDLLIAKTRDRNLFPLVFKENVNYGYRRNLWGLKPAGITLATIAVIASVAKVAQAYLTHGLVHTNAIGTGGISIILLGLWVFRVTPHWVKSAADAYARQLLSSCDQLST